MADEVENIKLETKTQFTARVYENDKLFLNNFIKQYQNQHEGMRALVASVNNGLGNDAELFNTVKELTENNKALTLEIEELKSKQEIPSNTFSIELPMNLVNKLTFLRRYFKQKNKIPKGHNEAEFLSRFVTDALTYFIERKYSELFRP